MTSTDSVPEILERLRKKFPDARYEVVDQVLAVTKKAKVQKMGFVGNEYYMSIF